jgi:hypothetical protein
MQEGKSIIYLLYIIERQTTEVMPHPKKPLLTDVIIYFSAWTLAFMFLPGTFNPPSHSNKGLLY